MHMVAIMVVDDHPIGNVELPSGTPGKVRVVSHHQHRFSQSGHAFEKGEDGSRGFRVQVAGRRIRRENGRIGVEADTCLV